MYLPGIRTALAGALTLLAALPLHTSGGNENTGEPQPPPDTELSYIEIRDEVPNPDRGFYRPIATRLYRTGNAPVSEKHIRQIAGEHGCIIHLRCGLEDFSRNAALKRHDADTPGKDGDLTQDALRALDQTLDNIRKTGSTAILRFSYDLDGTCRSPHGYEPPLTQILSHIAQLGRIISRHQATVLCIETGLFGPWGEQHGTPTSNSPASYPPMLDAWLRALPQHLTVSVRRPLYYVHWAAAHGADISIGTIHQPDRLRKLDAFGKANAHRIGIYNDGYLGTAFDYGTFSNREKETDWLSRQAQTTFYGGEVVKDPDSPLALGPYNNTDFISREGFKTHTTYLNREWNPEIIAAWKKETYMGSDPAYRGSDGYTYIRNHLGYRFVLRESRQTSPQRPDSSTRLHIAIENVGFGNIIRPKIAELILRNGLHSATIRLKEIDIRAWKSRTTAHLDLDILPPSNLPPGNYGIYLRLTQPSTGPACLPIRFANLPQQYDEKLQANRIGTLLIPPGRRQKQDTIIIRTATSILPSSPSL